MLLFGAQLTDAYDFGIGNSQPFVDLRNRFLNNQVEGMNAAIRNQHGGEVSNFAQQPRLFSDGIQQLQFLFAGDRRGVPNRSQLRAFPQESFKCMKV